MLQKLVQNSGLDRWIEVVISIDSVRTYQPHRSCYALVEPVLGVSKEEVLFVSSNSFDLVGAKAFGFKVASIDPSEWRERPATMFGMLRGRAEELGHAPDHTVSALTELPKLL
jgi:2-haloacid dehalogenase